MRMRRIIKDNLKEKNTQSKVELTAELFFKKCDTLPCPICPAVDMYHKAAPGITKVFTNFEST